MRTAALALLLLAAQGLTPSLQAQQPTTLERARTELAAGRFDQASILYREALKAHPEDPQVLGELVDALEAAGRWQEAIPYLLQLVRLDPGNTARRFQLARYLSWLPERRNDARVLLEELAATHPADSTYALALAELLSWDHRGRSRARTLYEKVLQGHPDHTEARLQYAELLSWLGKLQTAEEIYRAVVGEQPESSTARIGLAEVYAWSGRGFAALQILGAVPAEERNLRWHLARASSFVSLGRWDRAEEEVKHVLAAQPNHVTARDLLAEIQAWRSAHVIGGFAFIRGSGDPTTTKLGYDSPFLTVRFPMNSWSRAEVTYRAGELFNAISRVREHRAGIGWEGQPTDSFRFRGSVFAAEYPSGPADITGEVSFGWRLGDPIEFEVGFRRTMLLDSLQAAAGVNAGDQIVGRARLTLGYAQLRWHMARHNVEFSLEPSYGAVTGLNLETNSRAGVDARLAKTWRIAPAGPGQHWYRAGFVFTWFGFAEDLGGFFKGVPARNTGGYFSPTSFYNYAGLAGLSGRFGRRWSYAGEIHLGVQHGERIFGELPPRLSTYARIEQSLRLTDRWHLLGRYEFIDVAGAFRQHRSSFGLRFDLGN